MSKGAAEMVAVASTGGVGGGKEEWVGEQISDPSDIPHLLYPCFPLAVWHKARPFDHWRIPLALRSHGKGHGTARVAPALIPALGWAVHVPGPVTALQGWGQLLQDCPSLYSSCLQTISVVPLSTAQR